jgi:hypothetical protein
MNKCSRSQAGGTEAHGEGEGEEEVQERWNHNEDVTNCDF